MQRLTKKQYYEQHTRTELRQHIKDYHLFMDICGDCFYIAADALKELTGCKAGSRYYIAQTLQYYRIWVLIDCIEKFLATDHRIVSAYLTEAFSRYEEQCKCEKEFYEGRRETLTVPTSRKKRAYNKPRNLIMSGAVCYALQSVDTGVLASGSIKALLQGKTDVNDEVKRIHAKLFKSKEKS